MIPVILDVDSTIFLNNEREALQWYRMGVVCFITSITSSIETSFALYMIVMKNGKKDVSCTRRCPNRYFLNQNSKIVQLKLRCRR